MAVDVGVNIEGLGMAREFERLAARYGPYNTANTLYPTLRRATRPLRNTIKRLTPRRTGKLEATVKPPVIYVKDGNIRLAVGWQGLVKGAGQRDAARLQQGLAIEFGSRGKRGRPVMSRALEAHRAGLTKSIEDNIRADVDMMAARLQARASKGTLRVR